MRSGEARTIVGTVLFVLLLGLCTPVSAQWSEWSKLGPFGWGTHTTLHMVPEHPDWHYMTSLGDLYRRIEGEQQWYRISPERLAKHGFRIRIPSDDPATIYAVERTESRIFVSHDAGRSWELHFETEMEGQVDFVDPENPDRIIFRHDRHDAPNRLLQTFNKGKGWYTMTSRFDDERQYFTTFINEESPGEIIIGHYLNHLDVTYYISQNGGDNWQEMEGLKLRGIDKVLFAPKPSQRILAKGVLGWFKSTDRGTTWSEWYRESNQSMMLEQHPNDPDRLMRVVNDYDETDWTIEVSRNGGESWSDHVHLTGIRNLYDMQFAVNQPHDLWVVTNPDGLMSVSEDGSTQPRFNDSGASPSISELNVYGGQLLAGLEAGRLLSTEDLGNQWTPLFEPSSHGFQGILKTDSDGDGGMYTNVKPRHLDHPDSLSSNTAVYSYSSDFGQSWTHKTLSFNGFDQFDVAADGKIIFADYYPENSDESYEEGIVRSMDYGESWQQLSLNLEYPVADISKIRVAPGNTDRIYVYADLYREDSEGNREQEGHLLRTNNSGESWQIVRRDMEGEFFLVPGEDETIVYGGKFYFYRSTDAGANWEQVGPVPEALYTNNYFKDLAVFPHDHDRMVAVTLDGRLLLTEDGGKRWAILGTPPKSNWYVQEVELDFQSAGSWQLYVGTDDGVYMTHRGELQVDPPLTSETLSDQIPRRITVNNYPNPFNPSTTIEYSLSTAGPVEFTVYNAIGQPVRTIDRGYRVAGTYRFTYTPENLSSGVYLYRLKVRDQTVVGKFTLVK